MQESPQQDIRSKGGHALRRGAAMALCLAGLAGCANIDTVAPGTPLAAVVGKYGEPTTTCSRPDGQKRAVWSQQPSGSYAWGADIGADGRVGPVVSVLTDEHFERLAAGTWSQEAVRCEFGPPYRIGVSGLGDRREVVWSYRYMKELTRHFVMNVFFGRDGVAVTEFHPAPDDRYQRSE
jgi:hypothetical protein